MKTAGIREVRQNLSALLDEVKKGREVLIRERGKPVARLVPYRRCNAKGFPDLKRFRESLKTSDVSLSAAVIQDRKESPR